MHEHLAAAGSAEPEELPNISVVVVNKVRSQQRTWVNSSMNLNIDSTFVQLAKSHALMSWLKVLVENAEFVDLTLETSQELTSELNDVAP